MSSGKVYHSFEVIQRLKESALPAGVENLTPPENIGRRGLLKAMLGASAALAVGVSGCDRKPKRKIISRVDGPEYMHPGQPLYYSSTWTEGPYPYGLLVKTVDGRPIKIEGNPDHPVNLIRSTSPMQASILSLYDPDRLRAPRSGGKDISWAEADRQVVEALKAAESVVVMTRATLGPSERKLLEQFLSRFKNGRHIVHETVHDEPRRQAWEKIYGRPGRWEPRFGKARRIVGLDSDFLGDDGVVLEQTREYCDSRELYDDKHKEADLPRFYAFESFATLTGSNADSRIPVRASSLPDLVAALRAAVAGDDRLLDDLADRHQLPGDILMDCGRELRANKQRSVVVAGPYLPASVHAAVALLNEELDAIGHTLEWNPAPQWQPITPVAEAEQVLAGGPDVLLLLGVNPVYDWPGVDFKALIAKAGVSIAHSLYPDETAACCTLALPSAHNLESWNDASPRPGVVSVCQPMISPLFGSRQDMDSMLKWAQAVAGVTDAVAAAKDFHDYVRKQNEKVGGWEDLLRRGFTMTEVSDLTPLKGNREVAEQMAAEKIEGGEIEVMIRPHHAIYDGRFSNNAWLQELPESVNKVVWDNVAAMSRDTAARLGVVEGDMVRVEVGDRSVALPAQIQPGNADGMIGLTLGHGRTAGGVIAVEAAGANVALLLGREDPNCPHLAFHAKAAKVPGFRAIVRTQTTFHTEDRPIVLDGTLDEYRHDANFVAHRRHIPEMTEIYGKVWDYSKGHKWVMGIDLHRCIGCTSCVTACQAENNIPIVGREQVELGRAMHWLRIDRYEEGPPDNPRVHYEPMLCQHCDNAPCENVCPVNATAHSPEGLNEMTYNRCVGTRYCSNNCPYKTRRFNFLRYHDAVMRDPVQELVFNPQVTVRGVGVMEKCTFCVQRINAVKYEAANAGRPIRDGDVRVACQEACPARAITFGDINDPTSEVARWHKSERAFWVLQELNTRPAITYLARVRNPARDLQIEGEHEGTRHQ